MTDEIIRLRADVQALLDELESREAGTERLRQRIVELGKKLEAAYEQQKTVSAPSRA